MTPKIDMHQFIIIMGVSGSGKTTIGKQLSEKTGFDFFDADDFHPEENKQKMSAGIPLTDEDRKPWLANMNAFFTEKLNNRSSILACSALKQDYRDWLSNGFEKNCSWIYLKGDLKILQQRLNERKDHFMPASLLVSQMEALEVPNNAIDIDIHNSPKEIVEKILFHLDLKSNEK